MAFILPAIAAVSGIVGIISGIRGITGAGKKDSGAGAGAGAPPAPAPLPEKPTEEKAQVSAADEMKRRRRISLLSGGLTNITRGQALVPEKNIERKSLLGQ